MRGKIYIGHTANLDTRIKRHNNLLPHNPKSFTCKNSGFWELIYKKEFETRAEAIKKEKELKSFRGREFIRDIIKEKYSRR